MSKYNTIGALLILILLSGAIYVSLDTVKIRVDNDKSTFYVLNDETNRWEVSGREYNYLMDGTKKMYRSPSEITVEIENPVIHYIDYEWDESLNSTVELQKTRPSNITTITRTTPYKRGPVIIDTYVFNGSVKDVELFPINHTIRIINGSDYFYRYELKDLTYEGETFKLTNENHIKFGKNMEVDLHPDYRWGWVYAKGNARIQYDIPTNDYTFNIRFFDPPPVTQETLINFTTDTNYTNASLADGVVYLPWSQGTLKSQLQPDNVAVGEGGWQTAYTWDITDDYIYDMTANMKVAGTCPTSTAYMRVQYQYVDSPSVYSGTIESDLCSYTQITGMTNPKPGELVDRIVAQGYSADETTNWLDLWTNDATQPSSGVVTSNEFTVNTFNMILINSTSVGNVSEFYSLNGSTGWIAYTGETLLSENSTSIWYKGVLNDGNATITNVTLTTSYFGYYAFNAYPVNGSVITTFPRTRLSTTLSDVLFNTSLPVNCTFQVLGPVNSNTTIEVPADWNNTRLYNTTITGLTNGDYNWTTFCTQNPNSTSLRTYFSLNLSGTNYVNLIYPEDDYVHSSNNSIIFNITPSNYYSTQLNVTIELYIDYELNQTKVITGNSTDPWTAPLSFDAVQFTQTLVNQSYSWTARAIQNNTLGGGAFPSTDLISYHTFDADDTPAGTSISSNGLRNGTFAGTPVYNQTCKIGECVYFEGNPDAMLYDGGNMTLGANWSVCLWANATLEDDNGVTFGRRASNSDRHFWMGNKPPSGGQEAGDLWFVLYDGATGTGIWNPPGFNTTTVGVWHYTCFVSNDDSAYFYVDGNQTHSTSGIGSWNNGDTQPSYIGRSLQHTTTYYEGRIDEVGLWDRALNQTEITALYNSGAGLAYSSGSPGMLNKTSTQLFNFTIEQLYYPEFSDLTETPTNPATWVQGQTYNFTANVTDGDSNLDSVWFEFDGTSYNVTNISSVYKAVVPSYAVGNYSYVWYANDTGTVTESWINLANITFQEDYTVGLLDGQPATGTNWTLVALTNDVINVVNVSGDVKLLINQTYGEFEYGIYRYDITSQDSKIKLEYEFELLKAPDYPTTILPTLATSDGGIASLVCNSSSELRHYPPVGPTIPLGSCAGTFKLTQIYDNSTNSFDIYKDDILIASNITDVYCDLAANCGEPATRIEVVSFMPFEGVNGSFYIDDVAVSWYNGSTNTGVLSSSIGDGCFQEDAATSDQVGTDGRCNQIYTGTYAEDGTYDWEHSITLLHDGDYNTSTYADATTAKLYVNYTKPVHATGANYSVAYSWTTGTGPSTVSSAVVPSSCFDYDADIVSFQVMATYTGTNRIELLCYDGSWENFETLNSSYLVWVYEEAIDWTTHYTINKATSLINLTIQGTDGVTYVGNGTNVTLFADLIAGLPAYIQIDEDGTPLGNASAVNLTINKVYPTIGTYNITASSPANENWTAASESHLLYVHPSEDTLLDGLAQNRTYEYNTIANITRELSTVTKPGLNISTTIGMDIYIIDYGLRYLERVINASSTQILIPLVNYTAIEVFTGGLTDRLIEFRDTAYYVMTAELPSFLDPVQAWISISGSRRRNPVITFDDWDADDTSKAYTVSGSSDLNLTIRQNDTLYYAELTFASSNVTTMTWTDCTGDTVIAPSGSGTYLYPDASAIEACTTYASGVKKYEFSINSTMNGTITVASVSFNFIENGNYATNATLDTGNDRVMDVSYIGQVIGSTITQTSFTDGTSITFANPATGVKNFTLNITKAKGQTYSELEMSINVNDYDDTYTENFTDTDTTLNTTTSTALIDTFWDQVGNNVTGSVAYAGWIYSNEIDTGGNVSRVRLTATDYEDVLAEITYYLRTGSNDWTTVASGQWYNLEQDENLSFKINYGTDGSAFSYTETMVINGLGEYPQNLLIDVGADGSYEINETGRIDNTLRTLELGVGSLNNYTCVEQTCTVPIYVQWEDEGNITFTSLSEVYGLTNQDINYIPVLYATNNAVTNRTEVDELNETDAVDLRDFTNETIYLNISRLVVVDSAKITATGVSRWIS